MYDSASKSCKNKEEKMGQVNGNWRDDYIM